jgi:hypothetical protein
MKKVAVVVLGFLVLAGLIGLVATHSPLGRSGSSGSASTSHEATLKVVSPANALAPAPHAGRDAVSTSNGSGGSAPDDGAIGGLSGDASLGIPAIGQQVIKTGDVTVQVGKGGFGTAFQDATMIAARYGGFVESSSAVNGTSGWLEIRVPADRFEPALADLRALGKVKTQSVSGQDVTSQFVDLGARLRTWRAQEAALLRLMSKATTIGDTLRIQNELQPVQARIEQIRGELRVLHNQTALATIRAAIAEPGVPTVPVQPAQEPTLVRAWHRSVDGFLGVLASVVVGIGYLIPLALLGGVSWLIYRRLARPGVAAAS